MKNVSYRPVANMALEGAKVHLELCRFTSYSQLFIPAEMIANVEQFLAVAEQHQGDCRRITYLKNRLKKYKKTVLFS
jgi:hypothetical protein